jgi:hypothetical protein
MKRLLSTLAVGVVAWAMSGADVMAQPNGKGRKQNKAPTAQRKPSTTDGKARFRPAPKPKPGLGPLPKPKPNPKPLPKPKPKPNPTPKPSPFPPLGSQAIGVKPLNPSTIPAPATPIKPPITVKVDMMFRPPMLPPIEGRFQNILPGGIAQDTPDQQTPEGDQNARSDDSDGGNDAGMADDNIDTEDTDQGD